MPTTTYPATEVHFSARETHSLHSIQTTLRIVFGLLPIIAGADKFVDLLAQWENYLNPTVLQILPISAHTFMCIVGVIEIIAGLIVLTATRLGATIVAIWLFAIALQLVAMGKFYDIAVRDVVMAISAICLVRLTTLAIHHPTPKT